MAKRSLHQRVAVTLCAALLLPTAASARVVIKLGTLAPEGSAWHVLLKEMAQRWRRESGGEVALRIYPSGQAGDEPEMVRKMRIGQLHSAAVTVAGLSSISSEPQALSVPQLIDSYEELDYVRDRLAPHMEATIAEKGFVVLNWADAGWLRFFSKRPVATPEEMRRLKLFVWTGDGRSVEIWRDFGFQPVPLAATDMLAALQTGLIDATPLTGLSALATQTFTVADHMLDLRWGPLVGCTLVSARQWQRIPEELRPRLHEIARDIGRRLRSEIRQLDRDALVAMEKRGLIVHDVDAAVAANWTDLAVKAYPRIRREFVPTPFFDRVIELRDQYRREQSAAPKGREPLALADPRP